LFDALQKCGIDSTAGLVRSGGAVEQAIHPMLREASEPFAGGTLADARSSGSRRKPHHGDALNQQFAPLEGCSRILMTVHPAGLL
jgi:hypothetical protein